LVALQAVFPEQQWHPWRFSQVPVGYWEDMENQRKYFDWLAKRLKITRPDDWYNVSLSDVKQENSGLLTRYGNSLIKGTLF
jgi:hypothetical protein